MNNMVQCPKCGSQSTDTKLCAVCGHPFVNLYETKSEPVTASGSIPWETIGHGRLLAAFISTLKKCLLTPRAFFDDCSTSRNSFMAWLFALIIGSIGSCFTFLWSYFLISPLLTIIPGLEAYSGNKAFSTANLIFTPLIITAKMLFCTSYFHFLLFCTHRNRQNIAATFRIICYTQSAAIFDCIPILGNALSLLWSSYLLAIGFTRVHKIRMFGAVMIILLPPLISLAIAGMAAGLFLGGGIIALNTIKESLQLIR